jgi:histidine ammonia-lyase
MDRSLTDRLHLACFVVLSLAGVIDVRQVYSAESYHAINPTMSNQTIVLTGHDLTVDQVVAIARYGAKAQYGPGVVERAANLRALKLEADAEGIPVYGVNRGSGSMREVHGHQ